MSKAYSSVFANRARTTDLTMTQTPQSQPIPGREAEMVQNDAGGFVFEVTPWTSLNRFLVLGAESGTYYVSEETLTLRNAQNLLACLREDGQRVVREIVRVSDQGLAPKNDAAILALAAAASFGTKGMKPAGESAGDDVASELAYHDDVEAARLVRIAALEALPRVARTGTHLMQFASFVNGMRGWGRALKTAIGEAYFRLPEPERMALQVMKYGSRAGFTHRDLLRLTHPRPTKDERRSAVVTWTLKRDAGQGMDGTIAHLDERLVAASRLVKLEPENIMDAVELVREHGLPREAVPGHFLDNPGMWEALLPSMPMTATLRNLNRMTACGLLTRGSAALDTVVSRLTDEDMLRRGRIHPIQMLIALKTYASGHGVKGKMTWDPLPAVTNALDEGFYKSFRTLAPSGKRFLFGIDVSGSMSSPASGTVVSCCEAAMALAMASASCEETVHAFTFSSAGSRGFSRSSDLDPIDLSTRRRLDDVVREGMKRNWGGTDCSLPMVHAVEAGIEVDTFVVFTDNDTWAGNISPVEALARYRKKTGIRARLIVVALTATRFTIADPNDPGMLDVAGFDASLPSTISAFASGSI